MSDRVLLLYTHWQQDYWEKPKEAPYPRRSYKELPEWNRLANNCPLPALGVYIRGKVRGVYRDYTNCLFVYLKVVGMRFDKDTEQPYFHVEPIGKSSTPSRNLLEQFPATGLFLAVDRTNILETLKALGEEPPKEWIELMGVKEPITISWRDFLGRYFSDLIDGNLGDNDFEDRCTQLLISLGFEVEQLGHKVVGEYPDGEALLDDIVIVYDCKNISDYKPSAGDRRKLNEYVRDAKLKYKDKDVYGIFIAKGFEVPQTGDLFYVPASSLVYLLYKKIRLGKKFTLSPLRKILVKKEKLDRVLIDNEWRI